jgi:hypothetical protein
MLIASFNHSVTTGRVIPTNKLQWMDCFVENIKITDKDRLLQLFSQDELTIYIASDGGVFNYEGTFGVIFSDGVTSIAQNNGKFYSVDFCESSYRSEIFAMLSGIFSFKLLCSYTEIQSGEKITIKLSSDCRTLVTKINNRLKNRRTTNQHRDSDVDLELQLVYELQQLLSSDVKITIEYVRSHQELKKVKSSLSHPEQMNIAADNLTKLARKFKRKTIYSSLPQNPVDFTIDNKTINSKYALRSKKAYHSMNLRDYFKHKHSWSNHTIDTIWWKPYYNSLSKLTAPEKLIIYKFINNRLPTKARENKYYSFRNKQCSQCQFDYEDENHIIKCFSIKRHTSRLEWLSELSTYLSNNHTPCSVKHIIMECLNSWFEPSAPTDPDITLNTPGISKAYQQQLSIGWQHFIRGRLSIEWGYIISSHLEQEQIHHTNAEKWAADLLYINWRHILKMWRERCIDVHGSNPEQIEQNTKDRILEEIGDLQANNTDIMQTSFSWIQEDIATLRDYSSSNLKTWLYGAKIISRQNQQQMKNQRHQNSLHQLWHCERQKPIDTPIEKGDLDPGENNTNHLDR